MGLHVLGLLKEFRSRLHGSFGRRADALFELADTTLSAGTVPSPVKETHAVLRVAVIMPAPHPG